MNRHTSKSANIVKPTNIDIVFVYLVSTVIFKQSSNMFRLSNHFVIKRPDSPIFAISDNKRNGKLIFFQEHTCDWKYSIRIDYSVYVITTPDNAGNKKK